MSARPVAPADVLGSDSGLPEHISQRPGDDLFEIVASVVACVMFIGLIVLLVGVFISPMVWIAGTGVFVFCAGLSWLLGKTPAGQRSTARAQRAEAEQRADAAEAAIRAAQKKQDALAMEEERRAYEAVRTLEQAVHQLLKDAPRHGTPQHEAIAFCLSRAGLARDPRLRAEAERLARRHIAVDERLLCIAQSTPGSGRARPALLILSDRGAAVADGGMAYRFSPAPQDMIDVPHTEAGQLLVGELVFTFFDNPQLRIALAARAQAAEISPSDKAAGRPEGRLIRTARDAELVAVDWMRYLGFTDASATPVGADEGIDVLAARAVAQVKMEGSPTSRPVVQQLHGVASAQKKKAVFFSLAGYTPPAFDWASRHDIALFQYDLQGTPTPINPPAQQLIQTATAHPATPGSSTPHTNPGLSPGLPPSPSPAGKPHEAEFIRCAQHAGLRVETLHDIAQAVVTEQRATMVLLQQRFFLTRAEARRVLEALEQLGLVSAPAANGRRTVTTAALTPDQE
ncbi:restriction endonuclease [Streptomyces griseorubiginosus]|uniref:restriction endonuclease n=1 Tax=Streptomyces griseorubiginosus TaxID=67304 RepID=UPI0036342B86